MTKSFRVALEPYKFFRKPLVVTFNAIPIHPVSEDGQRTKYIDNIESDDDESHIVCWKVTKDGSNDQVHHDESEVDVYHDFTSSLGKLYKLAKQDPRRGLLESVKHSPPRACFLLRAVLLVTDGESRHLWKVNLGEDGADPLWKLFQ